MTSILRRKGVPKCPNLVDFQYINFGQRREGVRKSKHLVDVICVSPLLDIGHAMMRRGAKVHCVARGVEKIVGETDAQTQTDGKVAGQKISSERTDGTEKKVSL